MLYLGIQRHPIVGQFKELTFSSTFLLYYLESFLSNLMTYQAGFGLFLKNMDISKDTFFTYLTFLSNSKTKIISGLSNTKHSTAYCRIFCKLVFINHGTFNKTNASGRTFYKAVNIMKYSRIMCCLQCQPVCNGHTLSAEYSAIQLCAEYSANL